MSKDDPPKRRSLSKRDAEYLAHIEAREKRRQETLRQFHRLLCEWRGEPFDPGADPASYKASRDELIGLCHRVMHSALEGEPTQSEAPWSYFVARGCLELLEQNRPKGPSDEALVVAYLVDDLMDGGCSQGQARRWVAKYRDLSLSRVDMHHRRYGITKARRAKK